MQIPSLSSSRSSTRALWACSPILLAVLGAIVVACGSDANDGASPGTSTTGSPDGGNDGPDGQDGDDSGTSGPVDKLAERAWEVVSNKGETYLPNVFYADPSQNEQIMPWTLDGHEQINHLIYPTIGNPNLYTKNDVNDQFMVVLRLEDRLYDYLGAKLEPIAESTLSKLDVTNDPATGFAFFLISRDARNPSTESAGPVSHGGNTGIYRVYPSDVLVNPVPDDMPEVLKKRKTLRFVFKQTTMSKVPPGLYDVRFEMRKDNDIYRPPSEAGVYEYQYNAVRVFDSEPDEYSVINVTDTQVSVGATYSDKTQAKLSDLVQFMNATNDPNVRNASFITFNGDLHNGGSPGTVRQRKVAWTYNDEAKVIVDALKNLPMPIFLTIGNHDGYVATGQVPSAVQKIDVGFADSLHKVIDEVQNKAWPNFTWDSYQKYIDDTAAADRLGGWHRDLFTGQFARTAPTYVKKGGVDSFASWTEVPLKDRNEVLYDGFYQWQKTYGPLNDSWKFGKNFYINMNSFELRQHRRAGWGMYTVNYGGGMSDFQLAWVDRELLKAQTTGEDVILLAHHDPRGGHKNLDPGYYYDQLEYGSVYQSAINYIVGDKFNPAICGLPDWVLPRSQEDNCIHDGLQEWMRADEEFDCQPDERKNGTCDPALFKSPTGTATHTYYFSGIELMKRIAQNPQIRTVLLGHTHYNQLEVMQKGDELLPGKITIDGLTAQKFAALEVQNPFRGYSILGTQRKLEGHFVSSAIRNDGDYDKHALGTSFIDQRTALFGEMVNPVLSQAPRFLEGNGADARELVILRLVCNADLTQQTTTNGNKVALGFSTLRLSKKSDARAYDHPQINQVTFFVNSGQSGQFDVVKTIDIDRNAHLKPHDSANPIEQLYKW